MKILIAMSHKLTQEQELDLRRNGYSHVIYERYKELKLNQLNPELTADEIKNIAEVLVAEAFEKGCGGIYMVGEPALTFFVWDIARQSGLSVIQSTTRREVKEDTLPDGSVKKIMIFRHVQWRKIFSILLLAGSFILASCDGRYVTNEDFREAHEYLNERVDTVIDNQEVMKRRLDSVMDAMERTERRLESLQADIDTLKAGQILIYDEVANKGQRGKEQESKDNWADRLLKFLHR